MARDPIWDDMKFHSKAAAAARKKKYTEDAIQYDDGKWIKHTPYHWSRTVAGERLDYWPTTGRHQYKGSVRNGNIHSVMDLIRKEEK